jgi:lipid-A-disaccharide synthase
VLKRALRERKPSLLVLIDFPDFNLRLARLAKRFGVPVLYYVSPQVWAWRRGRVRQIARLVDQMAVVFPFEAGFYERYGVKAAFVGHPLLDTVRAERTREETLSDLGMERAVSTVALLPGSRRREVAFHLPVMAEAAARLSRERKVQFLCVQASTVERGEIESIVRGCGIRIAVAGERRYDALNAADLVWVASGTATLETALLLKPMIVVYRLSWLSYWIARFLVRVEHIAMVNLIAGECVVPELVQSAFNVERILEESRALLDDDRARASMIGKLAGLRAKLGAPGAAARVADMALAMIA